MSTVDRRTVGEQAQNPVDAAVMAGDDALIARVRAGDREAFALLIERYQRMIYTLGYRLLGNAPDAEDAAQETFLRAYTRLATYVPDGRFGAWLAAICSHWCIDTMRARGRRVQTVALGRVPECERFISHVDGPEERALWSAGRDEMQGWLAALPASYRAVLVLRYYRELSYAEIAETLGEPISAVRMRLFRARNQLSVIVARAGQGGAEALPSAHLLTA